MNHQNHPATLQQRKLIKFFSWKKLTANKNHDKTKERGSDELWKRREASKRVIFSFCPKQLPPFDKQLKQLSSFRCVIKIA
jgi:hypothetical protein